MKLIVPIAAAAFLFIGSLLFWRNQKSVEAPGPLSAGIEKLAGEWESNRVPAGSRSVTFVLADASRGEEAFSLPSEPGALDRVQAKLAAWFSGAHKIKTLRKAPPLAQAFGDKADAVLWTHDGSRIDEEDMARKISKALLKAHDAGAESNLVAQGRSSGPAFKALKDLEGTEREGVQVGANKVVFLGMNGERLQRIPCAQAYEPRRPGNVVELAFVWTDDPAAGAVKMAVLGEDTPPDEFYAGDVWRDLGPTGSEGLLRALRRSIDKAETLARQVKRAKDSSSPASAAR